MNSYRMVMLLNIILLVIGSLVTFFGLILQCSMSPYWNVYMLLSGFYCFGSIEWGDENE